MPFALGLLVFTFIFIIPPLLDYAEDLVAKGVSAPVVIGLVAKLIPQALAITIPMSLLLALLIAFGRLSADREFVAMQACGVSLRRLLRPVAVISITAWAVTSYVLLDLVPGSNQRFLDTIFAVASQRAEGEVKPRTFFTEFPNLVLYVRDIAPAGGGWIGVFMADLRPGQRQAVYLAERGRVLIDRERQRIDMELTNVVQHNSDDKGNYDIQRLQRAVLSVDPASMFTTQRDKGARQMTIAELKAQIAQNEQRIDPVTNGPYSTHNEWMEIHKRFSIPVACLVFGIIGLALGATHRRDGALGSFVMGIVVVFAYYIPLILGPSLVKGRYLPPWLGMWLPNFVLGALGIMMFVWRDRLADQPFRMPVPRRFIAAFRTRNRRLPGLTILDSYVSSAYVRYGVTAVVALLGIFYVSAFLEMSDKVFKGSVTWFTIADYFRHATPEWAYYALPLAVLIGTLVTVAIMTKNNELIVMKACGISLYRVGLPMFAAALLAGAGLFLLQETILGPSTRRAEEIRHVIRGGSAVTFDVRSNRWIVGSRGEIYHYASLNPRQYVISGLDVFEFSPRMEQLTRRSYIEVASHQPPQGEEGADIWQVTRGWTRDFQGDGTPHMMPIELDRRRLETPEYFGAEEPNPRYMGYRDLGDHTAKLRAGGFDVLEHEVSLHRKLAFPFVTLIMTLLAVPFASTIGRSGAMGGIAVGIALAISYWTLISIFAALGAGGALPPVLAAWAPNLLFGSAALYLLLTVRT